jgi:hypothetical protein
MAQVIVCMKCLKAFSGHEINSKPTKEREREREKEN